MEPGACGFGIAGNGKPAKRSRGSDLDVQTENILKGLALVHIVFILSVGPSRPDPYSGCI